MVWTKIAELTATIGINVITDIPQQPQYIQVIYPSEQNLSVGYFGRLLILVDSADGASAIANSAVKREEEIWFSRRDLSLLDAGTGYRLSYHVSLRSRSRGEIVQFWATPQ